MKTKHILFLALTALLTTVLFYRQSWGLNIPLFALLITSAQLIYKPELKSNRSWLWMSFVTIVSSLGYYFTNNEDAAVLFVFAVMMSSALQLKDSLLVFSPIHTFLNFLIAPFSFIIDWMHQRIDGIGNEKARSSSIRLVLVPIFIITLFLVLYANANNQLWNQLSQLLENINFGFFVCFFFCFLLILPLLRSRVVGWLASLEDALQEVIGLLSESAPSENQQRTNNLLKEALIVFTGLIVLLTYLIALDGYTLLSGASTGNLSSDLHSSIYILIGSMFMAIAVILYYYSLPIIHHPGFKKINWAVNGWIALNVLLCLICLIKNNIYVQEFGLTYKRIGVYVYLLATILSLLITAYKTNASLNNWMLLKSNAWMILGLMLFFVCTPWDILITRYNLTYTKKPDIDYIQRLGKSAKLEYYSFSLNKDNSLENKQHIAAVLEHKYINYHIEQLSNEGILSHTAEDYRMIDIYNDLQYRLK